MDKQRQAQLIAGFTQALVPHLDRAGFTPSPVKRKAKDIRAANKNRTNQVRKATKSLPCTQGGRLKKYEYHVAGKVRLQVWNMVDL